MQDRRGSERRRFRSGGKRLASGPVPLPVSAFNSRWPVARPAKGHEASKGESNSFRDLSLSLTSKIIEVIILNIFIFDSNGFFYVKCEEE